MTLLQSGSRTTDLYVSMVPFEFCVTGIALINELGG